VVRLVAAGALALTFGCAATSLVQCAAAAVPPAQADAEAELEGLLEVLIEDSKTSSRTVYVLVAGSQRVPLRFASDPPALSTGTRVRVRGRWEADGALAVTALDRLP
jgi:hypothetical protein